MMWRLFCGLGLLALALPALAAAPEFVYETQVPGYYLGSGRLIAVDAQGNATVAGSHYLDEVRLDIVVLRLAADGTLLWEKTIAGADHDYATGIALDASGDIWLTGWTDSDDFPLVNPIDDTLTGFRDVFLMKLAKGDGAIQNSTLIGGDYTDEGGGIAFAANGDILLSGTTTSMDFPVTPDAVQLELNSWPYAYSDAFVLRLNPDASAILYGTYLGGSRDEWGRAIAVDDQGRIVLAGHGDSTDFPLANPIQSVPAGDWDLFFARLSADGGTLELGSYLGGEDLDIFAGLALGPDGSINLAAATRSVGWPTTPGAHQEVFAGEVSGCDVPFGQDYNCEDMALARIAPDGGSFVWSSYLGGNRPDVARGLALGAGGCAYLVGYSNSPDYPPDGIDSAAEIVVSCLSPDGSALDWSVTFFSSYANSGNDIAVGAGGDVFFTGAIAFPAEIYIGRLGTGDATTAVPETPTFARLDHAQPNPFNPKTTLRFSLEAESTAELAVFDLTGRRVATLLQAEVLSAGEHAYEWDGRDGAGQALPSGVYLYQLQAGDETLSGKMSLLK